MGTVYGPDTVPSEFEVRPARIRPEPPPVRTWPYVRATLIAAVLLGIASLWIYRYDIAWYFMGRFPG